MRVVRGAVTLRERPAGPEGPEVPARCDVVGNRRFAVARAPPTFKKEHQLAEDQS
jgi:hypothetical protein